MKRLIKATWFFSLLAMLAILLYIYASLPENVMYNIKTSSFINRETFFYVALIVLSICNFSMYALSRNMKYRQQSINDTLINWQLSFAVVLNLFFASLMVFVFLVNSGEKFNPGSFGYLVFVSLALVLIWVLSLPVIIVRKKSSLK